MFETPLSAPGTVGTDGVTAPALRAVQLADFIAGDENHVVTAAVAQLLDAPTMGPLVLHGPSGVGKSLMVDELVRNWAQARPNDLLISLTGAEFAEQYAAAVDDDRVDAFYRRVADCDLLIIDDAKQLATKPAAQNALLRVLDAVEERGAAVVTLDVAPSRAEAFTPPLAARLAGGIVVSLKPPSVASRLAILQRQAERTGSRVDDDVLRSLATDHTLGVPEMTGRFISLRQSAVVAGRAFDAQFVRDALHRRTDEFTPTLKQVAEASARKFDLTIADLKSHSRRRTVVAARDAAMLLARQLTGSTLQEVGKFFGGRDHTTVLHSCRKLEAALGRDAELRTTLDEIRRNIQC